MSYIYELNKNFDGDIMDKYVWGERKKKLGLGVQPDIFGKNYIYDLKIYKGYYWGDILFTSGFETLLKKPLYEKLVENGFVNGYKTYKVINTEKGGPEYVGIVFTEYSIELPKENIIYVEECWGLVAEDFIGIEGMEKGNDFFLVRGVGGRTLCKIKLEKARKKSKIGKIFYSFNF